MKKADRLEIAFAMQKYGGAFVKCLGTLVVLADEENLDKIKTAFSEHWEKYAEMAQKMKGDS